MELRTVLSNRKNLVDSASENFRPPPQESSAHTFKQRIVLAVRCFLDIQFGSIRADLVRILPLMQGSVADIGCGAQPFRSLFSNQVKYIGVDTAESEAHFGYKTPDTRYFTGSVLPLTNGEVQGLLCTETLEHVFDTRTFLSELSRCLQSGGVLVGTVPFAARWHFVPYDYWRFTPSSLSKLLSEAGFKEVQVYARGNALTVACYKLMGCVLPLVFSVYPGFLGRQWRRMVGVLLLPLLGVAACVANWTLWFTSSESTAEDCLGYTFTAIKT